MGLETTKAPNFSTAKLATPLYLIKRAGANQRVMAKIAPLEDTIPQLIDP